MTKRKLAAILMMILGFWLFFIPLYIGYCTYINKKVLQGCDAKTDRQIKIIFGLFSLVIPGIILLCLESKIAKN